MSPPGQSSQLRHKVDEAYAKEPNRGWNLNAPPKARHADGPNGTAAPPIGNGPAAGESRLNGPPASPPGDGRALSRPPASGPPRDGQEEGGNGDGRPRIVISTEEHQVIGAAIDALASEPNIFQRANELVTILRDSTRVRFGSIHRPKGSPRIVSLPLPRLRELLTKNAAWKKLAKAGNRNGDFEEVPAHPPDWAINGVAARGEWPDIRPVEAIVEAPAMRPDGSILDRPGWDELTELLYEPNAIFPAIPATPTREDAKKAARILLDLVIDFPFKSVHHEAAWLAALLTPLARFAINGHCPLFMIDANAPGTGKSKLTDIISIICTGREMPRTTYPDNDEEMRKRITATALSGDRLMLIDNIATKFGGQSLDSVLTASSWQDRKLAPRN